MSRAELFHRNGIVIKVFFVRGNHSHFHVCDVTQTTVHAQSSIPKIVTRYHVFNVLLQDEFLRTSSILIRLKIHVP